MTECEAKLEILETKIDKVEKYCNDEFNKISEAFKKSNTLTDLLYFEIAVLLDILANKNIITEELFAKQLEATGNKLTQHMKAYIEKVKAKKAKMNQDE